MFHQWVFVTLFLVVPVCLASSQETRKSPEVEALIAKLKALEEEKNWPYKKLNDQADIVIIGTFKKRMEIEYNLSKENEFADLRTDNITVFVSTLTVNAAIKGDVKGEFVDVLHVNWTNPIVDLGDWSFYEFRAKQNVPSYITVFEDGEAIGFSNATVRTIKPEYLLFLKLRDDGRFEPVSGHRYAGYSVNVLND